MKTPIIVCDIDGTLVSERTGKWHPIIVPMLKALHKHIDVLILTSRRSERSGDTRLLLAALGLEYVLCMRPTDESPFEYKKRIIDDLMEKHEVVLLIDDDREILKYAVSHGLPVILP